MVRTGPGYLGIARSLGSRVVQQSQGWIKKIQRGAKKHKEREQISLYQPPNDAEKRIRKLGNQTIHEQGTDTSRNPEKRTMKEGGWETFNLAGRNQLTWEK